METRLVPYETLSLVQKQQLDTLHVHPEQLAYSGDIHCALNSLLVNPNPGAIKGFALLADDLPPEAFMDNDFFEWLKDDSSAE